MENAVASLAATVSSDAMWGVFGKAVPYMGVVILVALGFYFTRRMMKGASKGKAKI